MQPGGGYGTLKKRQDTESWWDAFLEQQAALQAQTLAQERAQAEGVGAAYTKYVRPLLERAALGLSTALSPIPSVPGSEPGTGLAQAIETSNANYERNKMHDISGRPVHGPVSYTHLDVYKRQEQPRKAAARGAPGRPRGQAEKYPAPGRCSKFRDKCVVE